MQVIAIAILDSVFLNAVSISSSTEVNCTATYAYQEPSTEVNCTGTYAYQEPSTEVSCTGTYAF